jgi:hypothetical protein
VKTSANANVQTLAGGYASVNLEAHVPTSQASATVNVTVTSGSATAQVQAQEPKKKKLPPRRPNKVPRLLMST